MTGWLDGWRRVDNPRSGGGTYDPDNEGYPFRIVLHTIEGRNFPNIAQDVIVPVVQWVRAQGGDIDLSDPAVPLPGAIPNSAREDAPQRLDPHVWAFGPIGLCGHRHVPMGDDHWDAGALDMRKVAAYARELLGGGPPKPPQPPQEDD